MELSCLSDKRDLSSGFCAAHAFYPVATEFRQYGE